MILFYFLTKVKVFVRLSRILLACATFFVIAFLGVVLFVNKSLFTNILASEKNADFVWNLWGKIITLPPRCRNALDVHSSLG